MAYSMNEDQMKEAFGAAFTGGAGEQPDLQQGEQPEQNSDQKLDQNASQRTIGDLVDKITNDSWLNDADNGFGDTYRALKEEADFQLQQYKDQQSYLAVKRAELNKEVRSKGLRTLILGLSPFIFGLLTWIFLQLGTSVSGLFGLFYILSMILEIVGSAICIFFLLLPAAREFVNSLNMFRILNGRGKLVVAWDANSEFSTNKDDLKTISFADEEYFLQRTFARFDDVYSRGEKLLLEKPMDGDTVDLDREFSPEQRQVLSDLRSLTIHRDIKASTMEIRREGGILFVLIGFEILVVLLLASALNFGGMFASI